MASRAFFRCRACGEPVVAGAYRCPVCAIDFPTGTPGAPTAQDSPAAVERARPSRADEPRPALGTRAEPTVPTHLIAARLDQALVEELAPPIPVAEHEEKEAELRPGRPDAGWEAAESGLGDVVPALSDPDGPVGVGPGARLDAVPERTAETASASASASVTALSLAPGRERAGAKPAAPKVARPRAKVPALREASSRDLVPAHRRRNKSISLALTIALALIALVAIGAGTYLLDGSRIMNIGGTSAPTAAAPLSVQAADGWVDVPGGNGVMVITATGPYRLRIDGVVYHVNGEKSVRVPMAAGTSLALRTAGEGTVAEVRPVAPDAPVEGAAPR